jgi:hypothetical protein
MPGEPNSYAESRWKNALKAPPASPIQGVQAPQERLRQPGANGSVLAPNSEDGNGSSRPGDSVPLCRLLPFLQDRRAGAT